MSGYRITIERSNGFGWHWWLSLPKPDPKSIGTALSDWCLTRRGAIRAANRAHRRHVREQSSVETWALS